MEGVWKKCRERVCEEMNGGCACHEREGGRLEIMQGEREVGTHGAREGGGNRDLGC